MARPRGLFGTHAEACGGIRRQALDHASAFYLDGFLAAALWLPPGVHPDHETMSALMARTVAESRLQMLDKAFKQMSASHPEEQHWYLPLIGTDPAHQSQGLGSLLMRHANAIFDRDNVLAYLESTNPRSIPFYERHGYELLGTIRSGDCPPISPMLRQPRRS
jgi:ribosomal protein S18 acetylase RimI-like enzyme